jgi:hypothetical protein
MQADGEVPPVPAAPRTVQITRICTVSELLGFSYSAIHNGGSARGYHELRTSLTA